MNVTSELLDEMEILSRYSLDSSFEGLKVHASSAQAGAVAATRRLYDKGLVTQADGGYLTGLGFEAAGHLQALLAVLR